MSKQRHIRAVPKHMPSFAFVAHYVEPWNILLRFKRFGFLHKEPDRMKDIGVMWKIVYWWFNIIWLFDPKGFELVDDYQIHGSVRGYTILLRNTQTHFEWMGKSKIFGLVNLFLVRRRIARAVLYAQNELKVDVVGLGAMTKATVISNDGALIVEMLGDKLRIPVTHGDHLTAAMVIEQFVQIANRHSASVRDVILTGSTSKIGAAVAIDLARRGYTLHLVTQSVERFNRLREEVGQAHSQRFVYASTVKEAFERACGSVICVTGKHKPDADELFEYAPDNTLFLNFSVPDPWDKQHDRAKRLFHVDGGLAKFREHESSMKFAMRLMPGYGYCCWAETLLAAHMLGTSEDTYWRKHQVGRVDPDKLTEYWCHAQLFGISIPPFTSGLRPVSLSRADSPFVAIK